MILIKGLLWKVCIIYCGGMVVEWEVELHSLFENEKETCDHEVKQEETKHKKYAKKKMSRRTAEDVKRRLPWVEAALWKTYMPKRHEFA